MVSPPKFMLHFLSPYPGCMYGVQHSELPTSSFAHTVTFLKHFVWIPSSLFSSFKVRDHTNQLVRLLVRILIVVFK
jgi:hypothetical protein